ncbi:MAG: Trk system potassium transporter TrkA [Planctomycetota bacterium]|jgi:trk system potassium uptake protein TrkA
MNVIICGAGEVGTHAAEVLTEIGHDITIIDQDPERLKNLNDSMDVRTLLGNCANADVLIQAGAEEDNCALVAATERDEVNLLTAANARQLGAVKTIARVHHSAYYDQRGLNYRKTYGINRLVCPEYSTAQAIASTLRNPAALAIENFASGQIEMQEFPVDDGAPAIGKQLIELGLPKGTRLAAIRRGEEAFLPVATTVIEDDDVVILVGNADGFHEGRQMFQKKKGGRRRRLVIMGGTPMGVWLCRALRDRRFSIRLFEPDPERAEELAEKLDWVTVLKTDPTDEAVFEEERIDEVDAFVGLADEDEKNILGCAWAKSSGVPQVISVVQQSRYVKLIGRVGIDHAFSAREVAVRQIARDFDDSPLLQMASLAEGVIDAFRVKVRATSEAVGKPLRKLRLGPDWSIAAIRHGENTRVPTADDFIHAGDTVMVIGHHGQEDRLRKIFFTT